MTATPNEKGNDSELSSLFSRNCRCGRPLDPWCHHRVGYAQTGVYSQEHHGAHLQGGRWSMDVPTSQATVADLKSSSTVCQSEVAHRLWWTPHCFAPCTERGPAEWRGTPDRPSEETEQLSRIPRTTTKGAIGGCLDRGRPAVKGNKGIPQRTGDCESAQRTPSNEETNRTNLPAEMGGMLVCTVARAVASSLLDVTQFPYRGRQRMAVECTQAMRIHIQPALKKISCRKSREREFGEMTETKR